MKTLLFLLISLSFYSCNGGVTTHEIYHECNIPGNIQCVSGEKRYCSMDFEVIKVCNIVSDCETECMHELVQILVDDIQAQL